MTIAAATLFVLAAPLVALAALTRLWVRKVEKAYPPRGRFATVNDTRLHYVFEPAGASANLPPVVFLHGASGNLADQLTAFRDRLAGRADLLFVDRPGHGWSRRGPPSNAWPDGQAATVAALMDRLGIERAVISGHSFGGAVAASFALNHPGKTIGALFLAPVSHPWPGGVDWYYDLTPVPVIGRLFSETLVLPFGLRRMRRGTAAVFAPNPAPDDFLEHTGVPLVLRPWHFRANATDISNLLDYVTRTAPRYREIETPAVVITGNRDAIVLPKVHSVGLSRDLPNAELVWIRNLGHKPDYVATDLAVAAIEKLAGHPRDLQAMARALEKRIADDAYGPLDRCLGDIDQMPDSPSEPI